MMIELPVGETTTKVDDDDAEWARALTLRTDKKGYVTVPRPGGRSARLHRLIVGLADADPRVVDHIDGNKLDNRRANLRVCTNKENVRNQKRHKNNTSGFKGVSWSKRGKAWRAEIRVDRKIIFLGHHRTPEEAHAAYWAAAQRHFGEFARRA